MNNTQTDKKELIEDICSYCDYNTIYEYDYSDLEFYIKYSGIGYGTGFLEQSNYNY